jgi:uncharacterized damage-inducible protein DinB
VGVVSEQDVAGLLSEVERARRLVYALLRSADARVLSTRPASGKWSVIENVRHLLFAEQAHLGRFLPDGSAWRLTQRGKAFAVKGGVVVFRSHERQLLAEYDGAAPTEDLEEVLRTWDLIHRPIRRAVKATGADAQYELERNLKHLRRHVEVIEKLGARASKDV